jgi:hypothetical protein
MRNKKRRRVRKRGKRCGKHVVVMPVDDIGGPGQFFRPVSDGYSSILKDVRAPA